MKTAHRTRVLAGMLSLASGLWFAASPAQAQIGTYEDFPYQQGSLGYRPQGNQLSRRAYAPRPAPTTTYVAPQPARSYYAPQTGYTYTQGGGYVPYTYPNGTYYAQPRRGLFGWYR